MKKKILIIITTKHQQSVFIVNSGWQVSPENSLDRESKKKMKWKFSKAETKQNKTKIFLSSVHIYRKIN